MDLRPLILWGLDPAARSLAAGFHDRMKPESVRYGLVRLFVTDGDPLPAFRTYLGELIEAARKEGGRNARLDVTLVCFCCASDPGPSGMLDLLAGIARIMGDLLAGSHSIRLALFLPPVLATDAEKAGSFRYLVELERRLGSGPLLNVIFVNELGRATTSTPAEGRNDPLDDALSAALCLQVVDREMNRVIRARGHAVLDAEVRLDGRQCSLSTAAAYRVVSPMRQGLDHMEARFALQLFEYLLAAPLDGACRKGLEDTADTISKRFAQRALSYPVDASHFGIHDGLLSGGPEETAGLDRYEKTVHKCLESARAQHERNLVVVDRSIREEALQVLEHGTTGLAEAVLLLANLRGLLGAVERVVCWAPLVAAVEELYVRHRAAVSAGQAPSPRLPHESPASWFERTRPTPLGSTGNAAAAFFSDVFGTLFAFVERHAEQPLPGSESLVDLLFGDYRKCLEEASRESEAQKVLSAEEPPQGPLRRALRSLFKSGASAPTQTDPLAGPRALFQDALRSVVPLYATRDNLCGGHRRDVDAVSAEIESFIEGARGLLARRLVANPRPTPCDTAAEARVLTPERLDSIQARYTTSKSPQEHLRASLQPETLRSRFLSGPPSLSGDLATYAAEVLHPAIDLTVLDVLEIGSEGEAQRFLADKVEGIREPVPFASAFLPRILATGKMQTVFTIRAFQGVSEKLVHDPGYSVPFGGGHVELFDSADRHCLELGCFVFGFPAFLIHGLKDARNIALGETPELPPTDDLWPMS